MLVAEQFNFTRNPIHSNPSVVSLICCFYYTLGFAKKH
jgi:hypothetical protein